MTLLIMFVLLYKFNTLKINLIIVMFMMTILMTYFVNPPFMILNSWMFLDSTSMSLNLLTISIFLLISMASFKFFEISKLLTMITMTIFIVFLANDMLTFYISFELVLIPTFLLITMKSNQPERLQASLYLLMYTITASLPLLLMIIIFMKNLNMTFIMSTNKQYLLGPLFVLAFLVKMPMFFTHIWLPKAHVEAPMEGSMILAAILLKMGAYGLIRFMPFLMKSYLMMSPWLMSTSLIGGASASLTCTYQKDLKALIAYSSVSHMALVICSLFSMKSNCIMSAMLLLIGHGLTSSALFFMVTIAYQLHFTRNTMAFKGLINYIPNLTFWWFMFTTMNIAAPPSINFFSEISIINNSMMWNMSTLILLMAMIMLTATFSYMLYSSLNHASPSLKMLYQSPTTKHFLNMLIHLLPLLLLLSKMELLF
uniref:NADH-ubiquinone oxidoreductase chain 4 n=1 Tax=Parachtes teruelis TaxID=1110494 RepID=A0A516IM91_9ARAC|nr:NADH dehydrogenase subunit 4 [Parachtes teruelis]